MLLAIPAYYLPLSLLTGSCYLLVVCMPKCFLFRGVIHEHFLFRGVIQNSVFLNGAPANTINLHIKSEFAVSN